MKELESVIESIFEFTFFFSKMVFSILRNSIRSTPFLHRSLKWNSTLINTRNSKRNSTTFWILGISAAVIAFDAYHYIYEFESPPNFLLESKFQPFKLIEKTTILEDTVHLKFLVNNTELLENLTYPRHVVIKDDSCQIARPYTPFLFDKKSIHILVKRYPNGQISRFLHALNAGEFVHIRGPIQTMPYKSNIVKDLGMIAGGTGIAPMYQLLKSILMDPSDQTRIHLVYANKSFNDILLFEELEILKRKYPNRLFVYHTIESTEALESFSFESFESTESIDSIDSIKDINTKETREWNQGIGRITKTMLKNHLPNPSSDSAIIVCGPDGFMRSISGIKQNENEQGPLLGLLSELGYDSTLVYKL